MVRPHVSYFWNVQEETGRVPTIEKFKCSVGSRKIYFKKDGNLRMPGEVLKNPDMGRTYRRIAENGVEDFYSGAIAEEMVADIQGNDGLISMEDLAEAKPMENEPIWGKYRGYNVATNPPPGGGVMVLEMLNILENFDLRALGHNSAGYIAVVSEAMKIATVDKDLHVGDPRFVDVPLAHLLSAEYCDAQRGRITPEQAMVEDAAAAQPGEPAPPGDTSYVAVIDKYGNAFSATPSDVSNDTPVIPGTGLCPSSRGSQSWANPEHASSVAPGKRPRLTPNPALAIRKGKFVMPFGTPGGDVQSQAMLQALLNMVLFDMNPQAAVEAPRFATYDFPNSFEPHSAYPGRLSIEGRFPEATVRALTARGHEMYVWPDWTYLAGAVCAVYQDIEQGTLTGAADPRRQGYAAGW